MTAQLARMAKVEELVWGPAPEGAVGASAVLPSGAEAFLPLEGLVDLDREVERLEKEVARIEGQLMGIEKKLSNQNFTSRAPAEVVAKEKAKADSWNEQLQKLREKLDQFKGQG